MSRGTCWVWWINEYGNLHSYRAFVTRRECAGECTLYLTYVRRFYWTAPPRGTWDKVTVIPALPVGEPWIDHPDISLEGLRCIESSHIEPSGSAYYRSADKTLIYVEYGTEL